MSAKALLDTSEVESYQQQVYNKAYFYMLNWMLPIGWFEN